MVPFAERGQPLSNTKRSLKLPFSLRAGVLPALGTSAWRSAFGVRCLTPLLNWETCLPVPIANLSAHSTLKPPLTSFSL